MRPVKTGGTYRCVGLAFVVAAGIVGCSQPGTYETNSGQRNYSMHLTEADVPFPTRVPFDEPEAQREYVRFYRLAYLTYANDPVLTLYSTISPISPQPDAAIRGHYDGQADARKANLEFWGVTPGEALFR